ncbi:hypothetical protein QZH41_018646 [Actinostola sp. cb2023]|nr:hypothetical protein QZH41_018646 [Actinostola sp. cb2023]
MSQTASDRAETTDLSPTSNQAPKNLFEVYANNHSLLTGKKQELKSLTREDVEKQVKRQGRLKRYKSVRIDPSQVAWTSGSKRVGAIGIKLGMSALWLKDGRRVPVTLVQIKDCQVIQSRVSKTLGGSDPQTELQVGAINDPEVHKIKKAQYGHFKKFGVQPKKKVASFTVTRNALLKPGTPIHAAHFYPGQYVKVQGVTKDHGFQGVMKRWGMKGQPKSHGQTKTHRKMGATGGGQDPGRIWPGKRMAGHMGLKNCTLFAVRVHRINTKYDVLYIQGQCPGPKGGFLKICDAWKKHATPPPFPTFFPDEENPTAEDMYAEYIQPFHDDSIVFEEKKVRRGR